MFELLFGVFALLRKIVIRKNWGKKAFNKDRSKGDAGGGRGALQTMQLERTIYWCTWILVHFLIVIGLSFIFHESACGEHLISIFLKHFFRFISWNFNK